MGTETGIGRIFVGRSETVEALHRRLADALTGKGGVSLVLGETGVGKSTLVTEFARDTRARGIRVLVGRAQALDDPPPYSLIHSAFESMRNDPTLQMEVEPSLGEEEFPLDFAPRLAEAAFPTRVGIEQRLLRALDETEARRRKSRDRVLTGIADKFLELTQKGLIVLVLDELHRADDSSLTAMEFLATQLQDRPLWIVATSRPYDSLTESRRARLEGFEHATHAQEILLRPLSSGEVASYLRVNDPTREFSVEEVARRFAATGGNPLRLEQLDRRPSAPGEVPPVGSPPLASRDDEARRILDVAAVLGPEFSFRLLLAASGEDEGHLLRIVDQLVRDGQLFERPGQLLEFPQDRLREAAYEHLSESQRRVIHQRAGVAREAIASGGAGRVFGLARDFYLGKVDRKAVEYNRIAAEIAEGASAPDVAREFLVHALESQRDLAPGDLEGESELVLELAKVTYQIGRLEEAEAILRGFLNRAKDATPLSARIRASLEIYLAQVLTARGDLRESTELAQKVLSTPGLENQPLLRMSAHAHLGLALYYDGHYPEALAHHTETIRLARETGNDRSLAHAQLWRAGCLAMMGQMKQALVEAHQVAAAMDRLGSVSESAQGHLFLGNMLADDRSTPEIRREALTELEKTVRLGAKAQDPRRVGWAFYHMSELLREEGRLKEASENAQQAYDTLGKIGDRGGQSLAVKVRGQVALQQGQLGPAEADLNEAYQLLHGLKNRLNEIDVVLRLAQLAVARGDLAGARRHLRDLERLELAAARPDLAPEFERLKTELAAREAGGSVGPATVG